MLSEISEIKRKLRKSASKKSAQILQSFFKTASGEYGEGDQFLGVKVPCIRKLVKDYQDIKIKPVLQLLKSNIHEERLLALLILVAKYKKAKNLSTRKLIYSHYLQNTVYINNWDLVDLTAYHIVGGYLSDKSKYPIYKLAHSAILWERRIAIISTYFYIREYRYKETLKIAGILLNDEEDLIHKAVGWMLREVGKRDRPREELFLKKHYQNMPRTMLRYAIERFPEKLRKAYLKSRI